MVHSSILRLTNMQLRAVHVHIYTNTIVLLRSIACEYMAMKTKWFPPI